MDDEPHRRVILRVKSCRQCRMSKRRCDRKRPSCSLCDQKGLDCSFARRSKESARDTTIVHNHNPPLLSRSRHNLKRAGVTVYFLDSDLFARSQMLLPQIDSWVNQDLREAVGDTKSVHQAAELYFRTIHTWLPIFSRQRFYQHLLNPLLQQSGDQLLVSLCVKLSVSTLNESGLQLYHVAKQALSNATSSGFLSMYSLQASILIAIFELGHALYPAAYLSIALSARLGTALGVDATISGCDILLPWIEIEERRRVWWAILILDRFVLFGCPNRHIMTKEPEMDSCLPVDDEIWDQGISKPGNSQKLGSSSALELGRFARLAQSTRLLSQVLDILSGSSTDVCHRWSEADQLRRTLLALVRVYHTEEKERRLEFCTQSAVIYCAVLLLSELKIRSLDEPDLPFPRCLDTEVIETMTNIMEMLPRLGEGLTVSLVSPFIFHALYKAGLYHINHQHLSCYLDHVGDFRSIKTALRRLESRWNLAGVYLTMLESIELTKSGEID